MDNIGDMSKDDLERFAKDRYGKSLDKRKSLDALRDQVLKMARPEPELPQQSSAEAVVKWLRHPVNGQIFEATEHLRKRRDLIPCDANGVAL
jgi:hypothetical protein